MPHVCNRAISSPARLVVNRVSPIWSHGVAYLRASSSIPRSRSTSTARWLVMCARGEFATHGNIVIACTRTP